MTEESAVRTSKTEIANQLKQQDKDYDTLLKAIKHIGHGRVVFDTALNEMIGAGEVERYRKQRKKYYRLTEHGRKVYLKEN
jgi:DNA-binding transcriptional regulator PaaX